MHICMRNTKTQIKMNINIKTMAAHDLLITIHYTILCTVEYFFNNKPLRKNVKCQNI